MAGMKRNKNELAVLPGSSDDDDGASPPSPASSSPKLKPTFNSPQLRAVIADPYERRPAWVEDESVVCCAKCKSAFSVVVWRHHCRNCGQVFCGDCARWECAIPDLAYRKPVRTCEKCWNIITFNLPDIDNLLHHYIANPEEATPLYEAHASPPPSRAKPPPPPLDRTASSPLLMAYRPAKPSPLLARRTYSLYRGRGLPVRSDDSTSANQGPASLSRSGEVDNEDDVAAYDTSRTPSADKRDPAAASDAPPGDATVSEPRESAGSPAPPSDAPVEPVASLTASADTRHDHSDAETSVSESATPVRSPRSPRLSEPVAGGTVSCALDETTSKRSGQSAVRTPTLRLYDYPSSSPAASSEASAELAPESSDSTSEPPDPADSTRLPAEPPPPLPVTEPATLSAAAASRSSPLTIGVPTHSAVSGVIRSPSPVVALPAGEPAASPSGASADRASPLTLPAIPATLRAALGLPPFLSAPLVAPIAASAGTDDQTVAGQVSIEPAAGSSPGPESSPSAMTDSALQRRWMRVDLPEHLNASKLRSLLLRSSGTSTSNG